MINYKRGLILGVVTALFVVLSFEPFNIFPLIFIAYVPLMFIVFNEKSTCKVLLYSWFSMFCVGMLGFQWIYRTAVNFGELPWWAAFLILIGFSVFVNYKFQVFSMLFCLVRKILKIDTGHSDAETAVDKTSWALFLYFIVPGLFVIAEILDPNIFTWYSGNILIKSKYLVQFAEVFGVLGLSLIVLVINVCMYNIAKDLYLSRKFVNTMTAPIIIVAVSIAFLATYSVVAVNKYEKLEASCPSINAAVIQANIGNAVKLEVGKAMKLRKELGNSVSSTDSLILKKYEAMSRLAAVHTPAPDLIVWPETAFPGDYIPMSSLTREHRALVKELSIPFMLGGYFSEYKRDAKDQRSQYHYYNSTIFSPPNGDVFLYHKYILLPFGEYMPLGRTFPVLKDIVPAVSDFSRGGGASVISATLNGLDVRFAPTICYEILIQSYVREMILMDANILLNVTNDSWFGQMEPYQHLGISRIRAVETRRPILRSTNTGITAMVNINGEVINPSKAGDEEILYYKVPVCDHRIRTFYVMYGYLFPYILVLSVAATIILLRRRQRRENRS